MFKLSRERIKRSVDEIQCDHCGGPVYVGEVAFFDLTTGAGYCSLRCAEHTDAHYPDPRRGRRPPVLFEKEQPSLF